MRRARQDRRTARQELPAGYATAAVGRAMAGRLARCRDRVHCRLRVGCEDRRRAGHLHRQSLRRVGNSRRRADAAAASLPDLDGSPRERRSRLGPEDGRPRSPGADHRQRRRQLLRLYQDAVVAQPASGRVREHALVPPAECLRHPCVDRRGGGGPFFRGQHRRRLRHGRGRLVGRDARSAGHPRRWSDRATSSVG